MRFVPVKNVDIKPCWPHRVLRGFIKARSAILAAQRKTLQEDSWLTKSLQRRNPNVSAVALANENARAIWTLLTRDEQYRNGYAATRVCA